MHSPSLSFAELAEGTRFGPLTLAISKAANQRYWASAGVDHPALRSGTLYPPIAANLTILAVQTVLPQALLQTTQRVVCHRRADADVELTVVGTVTERYEKRGRDYVVVTAEITLPDDSSLWTSVATFCEAGT
ncbi:MAG: hypothetical protein ACXWA9_10875 [Acidimicrobiia bacterium]